MGTNCFNSYGFALAPDFVVALDMHITQRKGFIVSAKLTVLLSGLMTAATLMVASAPASAGSRVDWSISIGAPGYYAQPAYVQPPVFYAAPQAVYEDPYHDHRAHAWQERQWRRQQWREQQLREQQWREQQWRERQWRRQDRYEDDD